MRGPAGVRFVSISVILLSISVLLYTWRDVFAAPLYIFPLFSLCLYGLLRLSLRKASLRHLLALLCILGGLMPAALHAVEFIPADLFEPAPPPVREEGFMRQWLTPIDAVTKVIEAHTAEDLPRIYQVLWHLDNGSRAPYNDFEIFRNRTGHLIVRVTYDSTISAELDMGYLANDAQFVVAVSLAPTHILASLNGEPTRQALIKHLPPDLIYSRLGHNMTGDMAWEGTVTREAMRLSSATPGELTRLSRLYASKI